MNNETLFRIIFFTTFVAVLAIRLYFGWKIRRRDESSWFVEKEAVEREGLWSIVLRLLLFLWMMAAFILYTINPTWMQLFVVTLPTWIRWLGAGLTIVSLPLLVWVHATLGRHWSTNLQFKESHALITAGPYRWVRHPMYTVLFSFFIGLGLLSANALMLGLVVIAVVVIGARIPKEEAMMVAQFGDVYQAYMQRTGRLLPRLGRQ